MKRFITAVITLTVAMAPGHAQSGGAWTMTSSTVDSGGGKSTAGAWTLTGTIGQADAAAPSSGGIWSETGGFWPALVISPPEVVQLLALTRVNAGTVSLSWPAEAAGYQLQYSTSLNEWTNHGAVIIGAGSTPWALASGPRFYFRLRRQ